MLKCVSPSLQLTLCWKQVSADKGSVDVLQQYDALLWRHTQQVVQTVIWKGSVTQTHQTDAVAQLACQCCAEMQRVGKKHMRTCRAYMEWYVHMYIQSIFQSLRIETGHSHETAFSTSWRTIQQISSSVGDSCTDKEKHHYCKPDAITLYLPTNRTYYVTPLRSFSKQTPSQSFNSAHDSAVWEWASRFELFFI